MYKITVLFLTMLACLSCLLTNESQLDKQKNTTNKNNMLENRNTKNSNINNKQILESIKKYQIFSPEEINLLNESNLSDQLDKITELVPIKFDLSNEDAEKQKFIAEIMPLLRNLKKVILHDISSEELLNSIRNFIKRPYSTSHSIGHTIHDDANGKVKRNYLSINYDILLIEKIIKLFNENEPKFLANKLQLNFANFQSELREISKLGPVVVSNQQDAEETLAYALQFMPWSLKTIDITQIKSQKLLDAIFDRTKLSELKIESADLRGQLSNNIKNMTNLTKLNIWYPFDSTTNNYGITLTEDNIVALNKLEKLVEFKIGPDWPAFNNAHNMKLLKKLNMNKNLTESQIIQKHFY
jgi:hypothetical protein